MVFSPVAVLLIAAVLTFFGVTPSLAGKLETLYTFQGPDGSGPSAALLKVGGTLYGTTFGGGSHNQIFGTVFSLRRSTNMEQVVYSFAGGNDGFQPASNLIKVHGLLYGTTTAGGGGGCGSNFDCGTVFSVDPKDGVERVVHAFQGGSDGYFPHAGLIDVGGTLYGTTENGGSVGCYIGCGTVFSVDPATGIEKIVYAFQGGGDGEIPEAGLINVEGTLYGTTVGGGWANSGTVFSLDPVHGTEKILYSFEGGADGASPAASLLYIGGLLYGTTSRGGGNECFGVTCGTVFSLNPMTGAEQVLYSLKGGSDGAFPNSGLIDVSGLLYGTTEYGGGSCPIDNDGCGMVFSVDPATGAERIVYSFEGSSDGAFPVGLINVGRMLYGVSGGGAARNGTVFSLKP